MGIKQFFNIKIFNKKSAFNNLTINDLGTQVSLRNFKGKRLCNDASILIYQSILSQEFNNLTDSHGKTTVHINTILNKVIQQQEAGIEQIWIFDSPIPNPMKKRENEKRKERKDKLTKNNETVYTLTKEHVEEIQKLLSLLGVMYIIAPPGIEAECYGSHLCKGPKSERFCEYMISSDSDILFFGGNLLKISSQKSATGKTKKTVYKIFDLDQILYETGLDYDQFLTVGVALGTDWNDANEQGIGPGTVIKKIKDIYLTPSMKEAIKYYKQDFELKEAEIVKNQYNKEALIDFLVSRNFNKEKLLIKLEKFNNC